MAVAAGPDVALAALVDTQLMPGMGGGLELKG